MREKDGFSLIELVITIAIMGILVGLSAFSLNYISQADARKMTGEINSAVSELKTLNMSKNTTESGSAGTGKRCHEPYQCLYHGSG